MGIDWNLDSDKTGRPKLGNIRPILLLLPGLSGGNKNIYTLSMVRLAQQYGFKCGTVLFKGSVDLPLTSGKFNVACCWKDASEISNYVHQKYVINP